MQVHSPKSIETDWLVIGAGVGGMAAALAGAIRGLDVIICEKAPQLGGTAATSAGTIWVPANRQNIRAGFVGDSVEAARTYLESLIEKPDSGREARESFLENGPDAIDWFEQHSCLRFIPCGPYPDYLDQPGAGSIGRAMIPEPYDGRRLGADFARVRPPIPEFMVLNGMMVGKPDIAPLLGRFQSIGNFRYAAALFLRYLGDRLRYPRGTRLMLGNALVGRLFEGLRSRGVRIEFETALRSLERDDGRVIGARVSGAAGETLIRARRGVVLATGGFGRDPGLRKTFLGGDWPDSMLVPENTGDGIRAGIDAGALTLPADHGSGAFWTPVSRTGSGRWAGLYPHLAMDRAKPGLIAVNREGRRFANEASSYHHFVLAMRDSHQSVPTIPAWLICNADFVRRYGLGAIHPGTTRLEPFVRRGWIHVASTIDALAAQIGVDAKGLNETVARVAALSVNGVDEDFGKGSTALNRYNGDPAHAPNPCFGPVGGGPYCAMAVWPAELGTSTGLETNGHAQVLDQQGSPIAGLYSCGNDQGSIMRGTYPGPGTTLGPALVFGWLAARHAASA